MLTREKEGKKDDFDCSILARTAAEVEYVHTERTREIAAPVEERIFVTTTSTNIDASYANSTKGLPFILLL
jgi:hypothetical protein